MGLRRLDLLVLLSCAVASFLVISRDNASGDSLSLAFRLSKPSSFSVADIHPKPIIVDFDGDGSNDVLLVTQDATVEQYKYRASAGNKIGDLSLVRSSTFSNQLRVSSRLAPAAAATGSLSSVGDDGKVLVVVTHGLSVHCLDSKLNILWERNLGRDLRASNYVSEASVVIEPSLTGGLVVVGVRISTRPQSAEGSSHAHLSRHEGDAEDSDEDDGSGSSAAAVEEAHHYSLYAFNGRTSLLMWKHEESDSLDVEVGPQEESEYVRHHYKIDPRQSLRHRGEVPWRVFQSSLLRTLPHSWTGPGDTRMHTASMVRNKRSRASTGQGSSVPEQPHRSLGALRSQVGAESDGDAAETAALIVHSYDGIQAFKMSNGEPITRLAVGGDRHGSAGLFVDVNGDGIIDQVSALLTSNEAAGPGKSSGFACLGVVRSGLSPHIDLLFNASICSPDGSDRGFISSLRLGVSVATEQSFRNLLADHRMVSAAPVALPRVDGDGTSDVVFLLSNGRMTSFSPIGSLNWQIDTDASWLQAMKPGSAAAIEAEMFEPVFRAVQFRPALITSTRLVVAGWRTLLLVSRDGYVTASATLMQPPTGDAYGDFNDDGTVDIIIASSNDIVGYVVQQHVGFSMLSAFVGAWVVVLVALLVAHFLPNAKLPKHVRLSE